MVFILNKQQRPFHKMATLIVKFLNFGEENFEPYRIPKLQSYSIAINGAYREKTRKKSLTWR